MSTDIIDVASTLKEVKNLLGEETVSSALKSSIDDLIDIVKALTNRIGLNSYNSSKPPSTDWNKGNKAGSASGGNDNESGSASDGKDNEPKLPSYGKDNKKRKPSGKKSGGQPGHVGKTDDPLLTEIFDTINEGIELLQQTSLSTLRILMEPGRYVVADHGAIRASVVRFSLRNQDTKNPEYWLYLSCGKFNGLYESDKVQYELMFPGHDDDCPKVPAIIAGPTCDSDDVKITGPDTVLVPRDLQPNDVVWVLSCGAYSKSYNTEMFNGFAPLPTIFHPETEAHS